MTHAEGPGWSDPPAEGRDGRTPTLDALLDRLVELVLHARPMPLSTSVLVPREEVLSLVEAVQQAYPSELRQARWLLKDRDEVVARARREADEIIQAARTRAERMVQRSELVREAERTARDVVEAAEARARAVRHESEDFIDAQLQAFEEVLQRTLREVRQGRSQLQLPAPEPVVVDDDRVPSPFDQDQPTDV